MEKRARTQKLEQLYKKHVISKAPASSKNDILEDIREDLIAYDGFIAGSVQSRLESSRKITIDELNDPYSIEERLKKFVPITNEDSDDKRKLLAYFSQIQELVTLVKKVI
ncbi:MAG: hypothetical protein V1835_01770 [Candidatus Micrarchaeota archaeon]